ncbi:MAG TPA: LapA family protein [Ornithinimicrobium sp.]|uniref:LapA family protein n=1 Tax=Ornithinimicrobium sp. TaxID=1977084 RepID=UPI002B46C514|nr:LapA family protein [Ornithinimicrobium sp.]HKJ12375.1 LapA family protein [Ornithinimicrobium sp.]
MFAAGLILIILAIIVVIYVIFATTGLEAMSIDWGVFTADLTPLQLFLLGAVTVLVLAIGSVMLSVGLKTQGEKRAEVKRLRKEVEKSKESRAAESQADSDAGKAAEESSQEDQTAAHGAESTASSGADDEHRSIVTRRASAQTPPRPRSYRDTSDDSSASEKSPPSPPT